MDLRSIPLFSLLTQRMSWLAKRQSILAQNIANIDTPGYKPLDLSTRDFRSLARSAAGRMKLRTTNAGHLTGAGTEAGGRATVVKSPTTETTITGNAVVLEDEMMKIGQTRMEYELATSLYRRNVSMLRRAIRGRG